MLNLFLLMSIGIIPFATDLMAKYLRAPHGESVAATVYGGSFLVMALLFAALNRLMLLKKTQMFVREIPLARRRQLLGRGLAGVIPYALATALAFISPYITLAICGIIAAFYAHPVASGLEAHA